MRRLGLPALLLLAAGPAWGHPQDESLAEAEYKPGRGALQVALRADANRLEAHLRRRAGKRLVLEKDAAAAAAAYLKRTFTVTDARGRRVPLQWVGMEVEKQYVWLYFQAKVPAGLAGAKFKNVFLFDASPDQVNTVNFKRGKRLKTYRFDGKRFTHTFRWGD